MIVPRGASTCFKPPTKSFRSGTWASTLLAITRSASIIARTSRPVAVPKNFTIVRMPSAWAISATLAAGSIPSTGISRSTK